MLRARVEGWGSGGADGRGITASSRRASAAGEKGGASREVLRLTRGDPGGAPSAALGGGGAAALGCSATPSIASPIALAMAADIGLSSCMLVEAEPGTAAPAAAEAAAVAPLGVGVCGSACDGRRQSGFGVGGEAHADSKERIRA